MKTSWRNKVAVITGAGGGIGRAFLLENRGNAVIDEIIIHRLNKEPFLV